MKPNIIIFLIDGLRSKNLSLYGYPKEFDKNIKSIASESIVFNNHFTCANNTYTSLTSLFTAKYPPNHGILHTFPYTSKEQLENLRKNKFWFPSYLSNIGYETYFLSLSKLWLKKGFKHLQEKPKKDSYRKINDKKLVKNILKIIPDWFYIFLKKMIKRDPHETDFPKPRETVDLAISKIKKTKKPFFMFMHFEDVHYPWINTSTPKIDGSKTFGKIRNKIPTKNQKKFVKRRMFNSDTKTIEEVEAKYNKSIRLVDEQLGRFYDFLKKQKLLNNTIFVIMADHGFSISEHNVYLDHAGIYDETIHVPLIMKIPKQKHKIINSLVQNIDIAPTILSLLKQRTIKNIDGKSMLGLIRKDKTFREKIFAFDGSSINRWAIRTKDKKLIFSENPYCFACKSKIGKPIELYDLKSDPNELSNIHKGEYKLQDFSPNFNFNRNI